MSVVRFNRIHDGGSAGGGLHPSRRSRRRLRVAAGLGAAVLTGGLIVTVASPAAALAGTEYTVTSFNDDVPACGDPEPTGMTLREAIDCANNNPGKDTVDFNAGIDDVQLISQIAITDDLDIVGTDQDNLVIHGGDNDGDLDRVFFINNPAAAIDVSISDLTLQDGNTQSRIDGRGGAILDIGEDLALTRVNVRFNTAGDDGGAIFLDPEDASRLTLTDSSVDHNDATGSDGGGIAVLPVADTATAVIDLESSQISSNTAFDGGGLFFENFLGICTVPGNLPDTCDVNAPAITVADGSAVDDNTATGQGGGLFTFGPDATVDASSVSSNTADGFGGGVFARQATLNLLTDTVVDGNTTNSALGQGAPAGGGGVYADSASFNLTGATVSNNHAPNNFGGGIFATDECLTAADSTISGNTAGFGGGG